MKGKVKTVLGDVNPTELGRTLTHEHVSIVTLQTFYKPPLFNPHLEDGEFTLQNLGWIRQHPYSNRLNMLMEGPDIHEEILRDIINFKKIGGGTVVENTSCGIKRNLASIKKISLESKVHFVLGTGFYVESSQDEEVSSYSQEKMEEIMTRELTVGCDEDPSVQCGFIGEVGCSWPLTDFERKSVRASAAVESALGCPVMIHPGRSEEAPEEIIRTFAEAGGNPRRAVMAHLERTIQDYSALQEFAELGTYLECDLFGIETSQYQQNPDIFMPSDGQRIDLIRHLIKNGFEDRILISHDIHTRHRLVKCGGHGFCHIINTVLPMMLTRGISESVIEKIMITNPAQWLTNIK